jgi:hypothetical protein
MKTLNSSAPSGSLPKGNCLPLTQDDIFVLRGKPIAKKLTPLINSSKCYEEEWIYYTPFDKDGLRGDTKEERFIFKAEKLIGYKTNSV